MSDPDGYNDPFDAYELGRAAAATLQAHNSQLSYELPSALQTLFSNNEFQEAMVVGGVVSDRITLGRIIEEGLSPASASSRRSIITRNRSGVSQGPGIVIPEITSRTQTIRPITITRREQLALRSQKIMDHSERRATGASEVQKAVIPLPKIPSPVKSVRSSSNNVSIASNSSVLIDSRSGSDGSVSEDIHKKSEYLEESPLHNDACYSVSHQLAVTDVNNTVCSSENDNELTIPVTEAPIGRPFLCLVPTETSDKTAATAQTNCGSEEQLITCLTCGGSRKNGINYPKDADSLSWMKKCREMMWLMLGMDKKQFDKDEESCPFCHDCLKKAEKCYWMSLQILGIQQSYDEICESLQLGLIQSVLPKTSVAQNLRADRLDNLKRGILQKIKNSNRPTLVRNESIHIKTIGEIMLEYESSSNQRVEGGDNDSSIENTEESLGTTDLKRKLSTKVASLKSKKQRVEGNDEAESEGESSSDYEGQRLSFKDAKSMQECGLKKSDLDILLKHLNVNVISNDKNDNGKDPTVVYRCSKCPCGFSDRASLRLHVRAHWNETGRYKCFICDETFENLIEIRQHKLTHAKETVFECSYCSDQFFGSFQQKANHELLHFLRTAICEVCTKTFVNQQSLKKHMASHIRNRENESRYTCEFCGKKFACQSNLNDHIRRHKGIKPLKCKLCHERFHRNQHVQVHFRKIHPSEDPDKNVIKVA